MKKQIKHIFGITITAIFCLSTIAFLKNSYYSSVKADDYYYTILEDGAFNETISILDVNYTLKCYRIQGHSDSIAVAWGQSPASIPDTFELPSSIISNKPTGQPESYEVVAIARAGFSHCTFASISVPQTVKDIREEAFAYCQNLEEFKFPKNVKTISPSTFLDCRELTSIYYSELDENGTKTSSNTTIKSIGNHAFDSCVKLRKIQCPYSATFFGESCFQKCSSLTKFKFPLDNEEEGDLRNIITVQAYAFADCAVLRSVYFDVNMKYISDYAFADSRNDLTFYFYGDEEDLPDTFESRWRNKKITTDSEYIDVVYNIVDNQNKNVIDGGPGLTVVLEDKASPLDNARTNQTINVIDAVGGNERKYAVITNFETPDQNECDEDYYKDGELFIPDKISHQGVDYTVKVIDKEAFEGNEDLEIIHFNEHLVQIRNHAFFHSNNISELDFSKCTDLVEVSYSLFNEMLVKQNKNIDNCTNDDIDYAATWTDLNKNIAMTSITLPNCLQYIGNFAFYNFINLTGGISFKTDTTKPSQLRMIGDYAFAVCSGNKDAYDKYYGNKVASTDIKLPSSLSDEYAKEANIYHSFTFDALPSGKTSVNEVIYNRVAVCKNCFENQDSIRTVTMESSGEAHDISFGSNVFVRCSNILRFESSQNICLIGTDCFKLCKNLREVFLCADRAFNNTSGWDDNGPTNEKVNDPWGINDGNNTYLRQIFNKNNSTTYSEIVIYVKKTSGANNDNYPNTSSKAWSQTDDQYKNSMSGNVRSSLPVHYVDWQTDGNIKYWHKNDGANISSAKDEIVDFADGPKTLNSYNNGYIALCKTSNSSYTVTRYYSDCAAANVSKTIDLTSSTLEDESISVGSIGVEAFARNESDKPLGYYFVLPSTITSIGERAFFRNNMGSGVRIVTFKNDSSVQVYENGTTFEAARTAAEGGNGGYCCLPTEVTEINQNSFYNNRFTHIEIAKGVTKVYQSAFYSNSTGMNGDTISYLFTDYNSGTTDSNTYFTVAEDGIYYTKDVTNQNPNMNKVLFKQSNGVGGKLTLDNNTRAVYYNAVAACKYSEVDFNGAYMVYGKAFMNCTNLTTLTNPQRLKYISWEPDKNSADKITVDDSYAPVDQKSNSSSFENCTSLKVDFSDLTDIQRIGERAFYGCTNLVNLTVTKKYKIYNYVKDGEETNIVNGDGFTEKVLDLSTRSNLSHIAKDAFNGCSINAAITPNTTGSNYSDESNFNYGITGKGSPFNNSTLKILIGETGQQADPNYKGSLGSNRGAHYYTPGTSEYSKIYYRVHSESDIDVNNPANRRYWTAVTTNETNEIHIVIFESQADAVDWYDKGKDADRQLDLFS